MLKNLVILMSALFAIAVNVCGGAPQPLPDIEATVEDRVNQELTIEATVEARAQAMVKAMVEATAQAASLALVLEPVALAPDVEHVAQPAVGPLAKGSDSGSSGRGARSVRSPRTRESRRWLSGSEARP